MIDVHQTLPPKLHYLGPEDSFSGILARQLDMTGRGAVLVPELNFRSIADAVIGGELSYGLLPVENNTSSKVHENAEYIFGRNLTVVLQARLAISMFMLGVEGADPKKARVVYSQSQALAQCSNFIKERGLEQRNVESTAAAAQIVASEQDPQQVCLGPLLLAQRPSIEVLESNVADYPNNMTRFFVVKKRVANDNLTVPKTTDGLLTSINPKAEKDSVNITMLSELKDKKGSLLWLLARLYLHGANLNTIESRPVPGNPGEYCFWLDMQAKGLRRHKLVQAAEKSSDRIDLLGVYPEGEIYQST